jgi:hypothetical protein
MARGSESRIEDLWGGTRRNVAPKQAVRGTFLAVRKAKKEILA